MSLRTLELLSRYESRTLVGLNVLRHIELDLVRPTSDPDQWEPAGAFQAVAARVLAAQAAGAAELWASSATNLPALAATAEAVVAAVTAPEGVPLDAFEDQRSVRHVLPGDDAGQLVGRVTELRYLRSDLHAAALAEQQLAGPRAQALHRLWTGADVEADRLADLRDDGFATADGESLTDDGRAVVETAEQRTNDLTDLAFAAVGQHDLDALLAGLLWLPGEDPRPPAGR